MLTKLSWLVFEIANWLDLFSVCVCFWDPCALKIFVERCSWELKMLFGSLVELHTWLHSYLCFSPLEKLFLKSWLDTSLIASYLLSFLSFFSYRNLDSTSTPGGSIKKVSDLSTTPRHLVDRSSIISCFWCFSSSTASQHMICQCCFFLTLARQMSWHYLDTSSVENYWWSIYSPRVICNSFLLISLSIPLTFRLPNLSHSLQTSSLRILKLFQVFLHLVSF